MSKVINNQLRDIVESEIMNFIDYFTSDDEERENMYKVLEDYIKEGFEDE